MILLKVLITIILDTLLVIGGVKFISTRDDADGEIILHKKGVTLSLLWITFFTLTNLVLNVDIHKYLVFNLLCVYNTIMAYTDIQSKMVWPIISYISALFAIINLIVGNLLCEINVIMTLKHIVIALVVIMLFKLVRAFGDGDLKIIFVNYLMIVPIYKDLTPIIALLTLLLVMVPFILINFKNVKGGKLRSAVAFAPYLMASVYLTMFI